MTIEDTLGYIRKIYPDMSKKVTYDIDKHGEDFCEVTIPNEKFPSLILTVTVSGKGCMLSCGRMLNITGEHEISAEAVCSAIDDVMCDRVVFVTKYASEAHRDDGRACERDMFILSGREDDEAKDLERLIKKLETPVKSKLEEKLGSKCGLYEIMSFSGKYNRVIDRRFRKAKK